MQKGIAPVYIVIGLLIASLALLIPIPQRSSGICLMMVGIDCPSGWSLGDPLWKIIFNSFNDSNTQKACTEEGKICPDGSGVGRVGPNCEFAECPAEKVDETANWKTYKNQQLNYQIKYPPDGKVIKPTWNTIDDKSSDIIIKFDFDLECVDKLGKEDPDTYVECLGESVDIFVFSNVFKTAQQIAEEDKKDLRDDRCTINTAILGPNNLVAFELTGCLVSGSSFHYLEGTDHHIFKIGVSNNRDPKTKQILSSFQIIKPDIIYKDCKVGKDDELKDQCPEGYECAFIGEYPDEVTGLGNCRRI